MDLIRTQDEEYALSLAMDISREEAEHAEARAAKDNLIQHGLLEIEPDSDEESNPSPRSLRLKRLEYYAELQKNLHRCVNLTLSGSRCKNKADMRDGMPGDVCYVHYSKLKREETKAKK